LEAPEPETIHDLQRWIGVVNYLRTYIPDFSTNMEELYKLLDYKSVPANCRKKKNNAVDGKKVKLQWNEKARECFEKMKQLFSANLTLALPHMDKSVILETDASERGYGGVLMQEQNGKREYVSFYSKCYSSAETRYSTIEKELLAVVRSIEHFKEYLIGRKFKLYTDHKPLKSLMSKDNLSTRLARWMIRIQCYDVEIVYKPGVENLVADWLSRLPILGTVDDEGEDYEDIVAVMAEAKKGRPKGSKNKVKVRPTVVRRSARNKHTVEYKEPSDNESNTEEVNSEGEEEQVEEQVEEPIVYQDNIEWHPTSEQSTVETEEQITVENEEQSTWEKESTVVMNERNFEMEQQKDEDIVWFCRQLKLEQPEVPNNIIQRQLLAVKDKCCIKDGILLYAIGEEEERHELIVLPRQLIDKVIGNMHDAVYSGHLGVNKTWGKVKERFYRPGLATAVKEYIKYCSICQMVKVNMAKGGEENRSR
jgi:hypothetical protein